MAKCKRKKRSEEFIYTIKERAVYANRKPSENAKKQNQAKKMLII
jgi:hypothetical protein